MIDQSGLLFIVWKDEYSVGSAELDAQHQNLVRVINSLYNALRDGAGAPAVSAALTELEHYTVSHFQAEEQKLLECGFPDFSSHKTLHDRMRARTPGLRQELERNGDDLGRGVLSFLKSWWLGHIVGADRAYVPHLRYSASAK